MRTEARAAKEAEESRLKAHQLHINLDAEDSQNRPPAGTEAVPPSVTEAQGNNSVGLTSPPREQRRSTADFATDGAAGGGAGAARGNAKLVDGGGNANAGAKKISRSFFGSLFQGGDPYENLLGVAGCFTVLRRLKNRL